VLFKSRLTLFSALSACTLVFGSANSSKAQVAAPYEFKLPDLLTGCFSLVSPPGIDSDCYADQNVKRASGFSHFDGSDQPNLIPHDQIPLSLQPPAENSLWKRLYRTQFSMHVIDKDKIDKTKFEIINGAKIYTDENFNSWTEFNGKWYVKMAHQFYMNDKQEGPLWCRDIPLCQGSGKYTKLTNVGVGGGPIFFAPILSENAPQAKKDKVNLGDWLRARPNEYDLTKPETVNARANFFVGGRGIGFYDDPLLYDPSWKNDALWNHVALVWVDPEQLFRPAQNPDIKIAEFAKVVNHLDDIKDPPSNRRWCISQFTNVITTDNDQSCFMAEGKGVLDQNGKKDGNLFDKFSDYYLSYWNAGSNPGPDPNKPVSNFFPFPFTGLGITYDPYYQAQLEDAANKTEDELNSIVDKLIGTSEFIYAIPEYGHSDDAKMYLDAVYPIISTVTVPGPLPILGLGASFAFTRRLRRRIRLGRRTGASHRF